MAADDDHNHDHNHGEFDPHAWGAISNAMAHAAAIRDGLSAVDPENANSYAENYDAYTARLQALQENYSARVNALPADHRFVVTSHDAFRHLGEETGLTFLAPQGLSTESEALAAEVRDLIAFLQTLIRQRCLSKTLPAPL